MNIADLQVAALGTDGAPARSGAHILGGIDEDGLVRQLLVDEDGAVLTSGVDAALATASDVTTISSSTSEQLLVNANGNRRGPTIIHNRSTAILYVLLAAAGVTTSLFSFLIGPNASYEIDKSWVGPLCGVWSAINGAANITEMVKA